MILEALYRYYETLLQKGEAARPGWAPVRTAFALVLSSEGELREVMPLRDERGALPRMIVPEQARRTAGVQANFLCDSPAYFLGLDGKGNHKRALECFVASRALHQELLSGLSSVRARAVCFFFERWEPVKGLDNPVLLPYLPEIFKGGYLIFRTAGKFLQNDEEVMACWDEKYGKDDEKAAFGRCLVTGEAGPIARTHPVIKGVWGTKSSGGSLVSFNADAFCSYGKEQSFNAPVGKRTAFGYVTALNHLLSDGEHLQQLGDSTVVYWAETGERVYGDLFAGVVQGKEIFAKYRDGGDGVTSLFSEETLKRTMSELSRGRPCDLEGITLLPGTRFYVLGLSPSAARVSVRFFYQDHFGRFMQNLWEHWERLQIDRPFYQKKELISVGRLLYETVNKNAAKKEARPNLTQGMMSAILNGTPYPRAFYNAILLRVRAERGISYPKAAAIKAFLLKNSNNEAVKEAVQTVKLNEQSTYLPYLLGRMFSLLENIQQAALPGISTTVKDRYFVAAASTPLSVFPKLLQLQNGHMKVLEREKPGLAVGLKKQLGELMEKMDETFPKILSQEEQGAFYIGYYHQTQKRFVRKTEEDRQNG